MAAAKVPSIGIIFGLGYSGGAIPLATTNLVLATRHAAFNTIQPKGLANIARQYNLSWQESARYVGVSPPELYRNGVIDGVIDWDASDEGATDNYPEGLVTPIMSGIDEIEASAKAEVLDLNDYDVPIFSTDLEKSMNGQPENAHKLFNKIKHIASMIIARLSRAK